ncbi:MAG: nitrate reductase cytochrome c-type subunit [Magnetospiraceae bacterium]
MKRAILMSILTLVFAVVLSFGSQAQQVQTLRGAEADTDSVKSDMHDVMQVKGWDKAYRQQPPLIPHKIDTYEIDLKVNQCLRCHSADNAPKENAPEIAKSHYVDRNGDEWDEVVRGRWFCNQCHVPQTDAKPLVENSFSGK